LAKFRLDTDSDALAAVPVPEREKLCGLPAALSEIETVAERPPVVVGLNVTAMVQLAPPATLDPQVLVCEKSPAFVPVTPMLVMAKLLLPVLDSVTDFVLLAVLMG
jgi:hypothetical protein